MNNWKDMFRKYVGIVGENEGVDFLYNNEWSEEEWSALKELLGDHLNDFPANRNEEARQRALMHENRI